jgi:hypothetical protein
VVKECHTEDLGNDYYVDYVAEKGSDLNARLAQDAVNIQAQIDAAVNAPPPPPDLQTQVMELTAQVDDLTIQLNDTKALNIELSAQVAKITPVEKGVK